MAVLLFANNAASTLAGAISNTATQVNLQTGEGALFPNPTSGQYFVATFVDAATGQLNEIIWCTARAGDVLTIVRAQEGTDALAWNPGDFCSNLWTAGQAAQMLQQGDIALSTAIITASGAFAWPFSTSGSIGFNRTASVGPSTGVVPSGLPAGTTFWIEDLAGSFNTYPVTITAPAGASFAGEPSVTFNVNRQCAKIEVYSATLLSVKF